MWAVCIANCEISTATILVSCFWSAQVIPFGNIHANMLLPWILQANVRWIRPIVHNDIHAVYEVNFENSYMGKLFAVQCMLNCVKLKFESDNQLRCLIIASVSSRLLWIEKYISNETGVQAIMSQICSIWTGNKGNTQEGRGYKPNRWAIKESNQGSSQTLPHHFILLYGLLS